MATVATGDHDDHGVGSVTNVHWDLITSLLIRVGFRMGSCRM